jgi:diaminopimelate decarboxylase
MKLLSNAPRLKFSLELCKINCSKFKKIAESRFKNKAVNLYFALKTNDFKEVRDVIYSKGFGAEVITDEELNSAINSKVRIVVNGHFKSDNLLCRAIQNNVDMINVESIEELGRVQFLAETLSSMDINVGIRMRIKENKIIGFPKAAIEKIKIGQFKNLNLRGLHFHAGWNVRDDNEIVMILKEMQEYLKLLGSISAKIDTVNLGGSFIEPTEDGSQLSRRMDLYDKAIPEYITNVHFEPGRYIVGNCGMLESTVFEERDNCSIINSCAYGHSLIGATKRVSIIPSKFRCKDYPQKIVISGHWPCEEDRIEIIKSEYIPRNGDKVIFNNMGAYCSEWRMQFDYNKGLDYDFETNLSLLLINIAPEDRNTILNRWDFFKDRFNNLPVKYEEQTTVLNALSELFKAKKEWTENEVNKILYNYHDDYCLLRRELVDRGYMKREAMRYYICSS